MKLFGIVVAAALLIVILWAVVASIASYFGGHLVPDGLVPDAWSGPDTWATWRDIVIVFSAGFWVLGGLMLMIMMGVLIWLLFEIRKLLKNNVAPAVDSLRDSLDNVRGTTEFAGETVASPLIRAYSIVRGVRSGTAALRSFPQNVRGRKKSKKPWQR